MVNLVVLGAGRIGQVHAHNIALATGARLHSVFDVDSDKATALATRYNAQVASDARSAIADPTVDGVLICTSTDTHVEMIELALRTGRERMPIFCEKPIDLDMERVTRCLLEVERAGALLLLGFNRRFDPHFRALSEALERDELGRLETLRITSRDPEPPPPDYVAVSGGLFRDMMIHDLDMARFLMREEPIELYATGSCLVDPAIGDAGDIDTAVVVLRTATGTLCTIENSRRAVYGYDQRIEAFGAEGMITANNPTPTTLTRATAEAVLGDRPPWFFLERYDAAYRAELEHFIDIVEGKTLPQVGGCDGRAALTLADAAVQSLAERRPIWLES